MQRNCSPEGSGRPLEGDLALRIGGAKDHLDEGVDQPVEGSVRGRSIRRRPGRSGTGDGRPDALEDAPRDVLGGQYAGAGPRCSSDDPYRTTLNGGVRVGV